MSFPNLDMRPLKSILSTKVASFHKSDKGQLPIPDKRTTSLRCKLDSQPFTDRKKSTNFTTTATTTTTTSTVTSNISTTVENAPLTVRPNEYTKTSLDRQSPHDRAKKRLILHQQQQQLHHQQQQQNTQQQEITSPQLEQLDPSDDVFVKYYKKINSANKTFSTFRGPPPDPGKYLRDEDESEEKPLSPENQVVPDRFKPINEEKHEEEAKGETNLDYTPLSFDTNYVKVSPPKLMRRQKKSGGSESDSSGQSTNGFSNMKLKKEKLQSPKKNETKIVNFSTDKCESEKLTDGPDSANDSTNSDVFTDDPPINPLLQNRISTSSNGSEDFPPPPPQLLEPTSEYISLESAEKSLLSQNSEDKSVTIVTEKVYRKDEITKPLATNDTKVTNKIGTVFPRKISSINKEVTKSQTASAPITSNGSPPVHVQTIYTPSNPGESVMELKLTLRLEGNGQNQKMTVQRCEDGDTKKQNMEDENPSKTSIEFNSAIVTQICQAVTTLAKDQLVKDEPIMAFVKNKSANNGLTQTNLLYDENANIPKTKNSIDASTPKCFQNIVYGLPISANVPDKTESQTLPNKNIKTSIKKCNITLEKNSTRTGDSTIKRSLADYGTGKITTVADVHHSAENNLHNYTALDMKPMSNENIANDTQQQRYTSIKPQSPDSNCDKNYRPQNKILIGENDGDDDDDSNDFEKLDSSVMTHMNWDDLMQEAQTLGIPLNRPTQAIVPSNSAVSISTKKTTGEHKSITALTTEITKIPVKIASKTTSLSTSPINRPISVDSAVGISVSSSSKSVFTLPKNSAPTLASHKAALQKSTVPCGKHNSCCTSPSNIYDQPRRFNRRSFSASNKQSRCNENLINCCHPVKQNLPKQEKRFYYFRIKLANLFCKRLCGRNNERQKQLEQLDQQVCYKASSESYKCTCTTRSSHYPDHLSSSISAKQLSAYPKKHPNGRVAFPSKRDLDTESFLSDTTLTCNRSVRIMKPVSNGSCIHNHDSHRPSKHSRNSPDKWSGGDTIDLYKSLEKLKNHAWYWGPIGFEEAESLLANQNDGSFLVRDSSDDRYILSLSFRSEGLTHHTRIEQHKGRFSFFSHWSPHQASTVDRFIMEAMELSKQGKCLYYLKAKHPSSIPISVRLLYPVLRP